jgi:hypothetical protein
MLLHAIHNSALLTVERWFPALHPEATDATINGSVGPVVLTTAAVIALVGAGLIWASRRPTSVPDAAVVSSQL